MDLSLQTVFDFVQLALLIIEPIVLAIVFAEVVYIRKHSKRLEMHAVQLAAHADQLTKHAVQLESIRPFISNLYSDKKEILQLAIDFVKEAGKEKAGKILVSGTISILSKTEIEPGEEPKAFLARKSQVDSLRLQYVEETETFIKTKKEYKRIMSLIPESNSHEDAWEVLANVQFFRDILTKNSGLNFHLYHYAEIPSSKEDFHFRCSNTTVNIRVGGLSRQEAYAAAIQITDARVVSKFTEYYNDLLKDKKQCKEVDVNKLALIHSLYSRAWSGGTFDESAVDGIKRKVQAELDTI